MNQPYVDAGQARLNLTWDGQSGDLPDTVPVDASDLELKAFAAEAVRNGDIPGVGAAPHAVLADFVVDRFPATAEIPWARVFVRPKTPFG